MSLRTPEEKAVFDLYLAAQEAMDLIESYFDADTQREGRVYGDLERASVRVRRLGLVKSYEELKERDGA